MASSDKPQDQFANAYSVHLAQVNEVQAVVAAADIFNTQGQLIIKKGAPIDQKMSDKIALFKLAKPLEDSIMVENEFSASRLLSRLQLYLDMDPCLKQLAPLEEAKFLLACCEVFCKFALLRQKLTVLAIQLPVVFEQALFCAWMGVVLMRKMGRSEGDCYTIFVAGLAHDLGMLHLHPDILQKPGGLTPEEWRQMQAHPVIGARILNQVPKLPPEVSRAVLEHHEALDGTGYPQGKMGEALSPFGQLLNLLDSVNAVYRKQFKPYQRSLREVISVVQMNSHSRFGGNGAALIQVLKCLPEPLECGVPKALMNDFLIAVKGRNKYLSFCVDALNELAPQIGFTHKNPNLTAIQNGIIHIAVCIVQSGIINEAYMRWLDQVMQENLVHAYRETEEAFILIQELIYHVEKVKNQLRAFVEFDAVAGKMPCLQETLKKMEDKKPPKVLPSLAEVWLTKGLVGS